MFKLSPTSRFHSENLQQNDNADYQCIVSGYPKPEIIWTLEGRSIVSSRFQQIQTNQGGRLLILAVNAEDAGELRCNTRNYLGSDYAAKVLSVTGNLYTQPAFTYSKLSRITLGQDVKYVQS